MEEVAATYDQVIHGLNSHLLYFACELLTKTSPPRQRKLVEFASPIPPPPCKFLCTGLNWLFIKQYATFQTAVTLIDIKQE